MTDLAPGPAGDARIAEAMGTKNSWQAVAAKTPQATGDSYYLLFNDLAKCQKLCDGLKADDGRAWEPLYIGPAYTTSCNGLLAMLEWMAGEPRLWEIVVSSVRYDSSPGRIVTVFAADWTQLAHIVDMPLVWAVGEALLAAVEETTT